MKFTKETTDDQKKLYFALTNNWKQYCGTLERIEDAELKNASLAMANALADRLIVCPASSKIEYGGCFPGGLVLHSLNVYRNFELLRGSMDVKKEVNSDSAIVLSLFHDLGKLGTKDEDFYLPQKSDWHREKLGQLFTINTEISNISVPARTFEWLSSYNVPMTSQLFQAIMSATFTGNDELNRSGINNIKDSWEGFLLQAAIKSSLLGSPKVATILDT